MAENTETLLVAAIATIAVGISAWGFQRARPYGKLGILAWLQSVLLMAPWLLFFGLFAAGIYLNLVAILFLLIASTGAYIYLGRRLRAEGQEAILRERAARRLQVIETDDASVRTDTEQTIPTDATDDGESATPIPNEDLKAVQGIFGIDTFFATETIPYQDGAIFKGNLRSDPDVAYQQLVDKLRDRLGEKYRLFLVESPENRPVAIVLPSTNDPRSLTVWQKGLVLALAIAAIATSCEAFGLLVGFDFFTTPHRYGEILPLVLGLWAILVAHELGHFWMAKRHGLKLSWPFFIPSFQIGAFGAITRLESLVPTRSVLFDVAIAGPAAGGLLSLLMVVMGLVLSHPGSAYQLPTEFFKSSVLVGSLARVVLGEQLQTSIVDIHPLTVVGWLGLAIASLNLLPAGQLDGGRIVQAIYGRKTARRTTVATLIVLGIVAVFNPGNPIPLYWGVLILFLQRNLERPSLNELTEPDDARAALGLLALFLMLAALIPLSPSLAGRLGIGG
ncbi:putative membrane-associated Zn-dependent protease 1 [Rubidibacter lacunae KORDI 51-2]|uniref:Putative membrane-associated Zn-dependent protease 1 n=1 Tax=Rubidibacter lacunae KORDI 51-2 TaxID=582515 RepID=U5DG15_9CHRO|nr:site-2 protease family protein [Rubidibacter lacunae]ERN40202.1 putative membrane-associated Zn-dependent protease 1 [Rubidibacter lacunae KORDI 51-2]